MARKDYMKKYNKEYYDKHKKEFLAELKLKRNNNEWRDNNLLYQKKYHLRCMINDPNKLRKKWQIDYN